MLKKHTLAFVLSVFVILSPLPLTASFSSSAKEQTVELPRRIYEFGEKSEYEIESTESSQTSEKVIGNFSLDGDINKTYTKDGFTAYEIASDKLFSLSFNYDDTLSKEPNEDWHLVDDNKKVVNGVELDNKIENAAIIYQTSFDGKSWVTNLSKTNVKSDVEIKNDGDDSSKSNEYINCIQLNNGCYYRIIVAYKLEKKLKDSSVLFVDTSDYEYKKIAEVFEFYAGYNIKSEAVSGKKKYFEVGGTNGSPYTARTKTNDYVGSEKIESKDPHYDWNLGRFCLNGYTDNGDEPDVYFKTVGNKISLSFELEQDINKLNGNSELEIVRDKKGSDGAFQSKAHDMGRGELIVKFTDADGSTRRIEYSNYLEALAYPGADTKIQLFEEGDYDVHLDYAIKDKEGINSTTYYRAAFSFKIRNGNCMVYLFDSKDSNNELTNGSTTNNGFRIDTALSKYPKIMVKKEVLNSSGDDLDTRFNRAATDGEIFTDEGVYTITNVNRSNGNLSTEKIVYVGSNTILKAYTKNVDKNGKPTITIEQINNRLDEGWIINDDGDLTSPVSDETTMPVITTTTIETTEVVSVNENTTIQTAESVVEPTEKKSSPLVPIICGILILTGIGGGVGYYIFKNKKKQ